MRLFPLLPCLLLGALGEGYYSRLPDLRTSEGTWDTPFSPEHFSYDIHLPSEVAEVTIEAVVDFARYAGPEDYPLLFIDGEERHYGSNDLIATSIALGPNADSRMRDVAVTVRQPGAASNATTANSTYWLHLRRAADLDKLLQPQALSLVAEGGGEVELLPAFNSSLRSYQASLLPQVQHVKVNFRCDPLAQAEVEGKRVQQGQEAFVDVKQRQRTTVLRAACVYGSDRRTLQVLLFEDADLAELAATLEILVLGSEGKIVRTSNDSFSLLATAPQVELVPVYSDARVMLRLHLPHEEDLTLGPGIPSPSLTVPRNGSRRVELLLSSHTASKSVFVTMARRDALPSPGDGGDSPEAEPEEEPGTVWQRGERLGYGVAGVVAGCSLLGAFVTGLSQALGRGVALESSAALSSLTLLLQFVALGNIAEGPSILGDYAKSLRWLCLVPDVALAPFDSLDEQDLGLSEAQACLCSCVLLLSALASLHLLVLVLRVCAGFRRTMPHGLAMGTWEVKCLQLVAFPASFMGSLIWLCPADVLPGSGWQDAAVVAVLAPVAVGVTAMLAVQKAMRDKLVAWVSEETGCAPGTRDANDLGSNWGGHFCDAECDQICTMPQECCCLSGLPLRWASTCAQIRTQSLASLLTAAGGVELQEDGEEASDSDEDLQHLLLPRQMRSTAVVDVVSTCSSCNSGCCGSQADVGFCAGVDWLEALLGPKDLVRLLQEAQTAAARQKLPKVPLRVELLQLQGPLTCGRLSFCFSGMRWPLFPAQELAARALLGMLSACAVMKPEYRAFALAGCCALATGLFAVTFAHAPCSTFRENAILLLTQLGLALASAAYLGYATGALPEEVCGGIVVVCSMAAVLPGLLHSLFRTLALCSAASGSRTCAPSKQESEARKLCNATLGLRFPKDTEMLQVPAKCRVPVAAFIVHAVQTSRASADVRVDTVHTNASRPQLEFPVLDYIALTDRLEPPRALLTGPSQTQEGYSPLGYRFEAVYGDEDPAAIIRTFVERSVGIDIAPDVSPQILSIFTAHAARGLILLIQIVAPEPQDASSPAGVLACCGVGWSSSSSEDSEVELGLMSPSAE